MNKDNCYIYSIQNKKRIPLKCPECGLEFLIYPQAMIKGGFCSIKCKRIFKRRTKEPLICLNCKNKFLPFNPNSSAGFCSVSCSSQYYGKIRHAKFIRSKSKKRVRRELTNGYIKNLIKRRWNLSNQFITQDIIDNTRMGIIIKRELKKKRKMSDSHKGFPSINRRAVNQYSLNGKFLCRWESCSVAAEKYKIDRGCIASAARGRSANSCGYKWSYDDCRGQALNHQPYQNRSPLPGQNNQYEARRQG